jgi:hypothetical protein
MNMIGFWSLSRLRPVRKESSSQRRRQTWPQGRASDRWGPKAVSIQRAEGNARGAHARVSWGSNQPGRKRVRDEAEVEESTRVRRGFQFPPESGQSGPYRTVPVLSHFLPGPPSSLAVRPNTSIHTLPRGAKYPFLNWSTSPLQSPVQSIAPRFTSQIDSSFRLLGTVHSTFRTLRVCNHNNGQKRGSGDFVGKPTVLIIAVPSNIPSNPLNKSRLDPKDLSKCL